jgi:hypothetical protein
VTTATLRNIHPVPKFIRPPFSGIPEDSYTEQEELVTSCLTAFERPVTLFVGLGFPRQLASASEAFELLCKMPDHIRGPSHSAALKACRAAMVGEIEAETARGIVEAYARGRGILVEKPVADSAMAAKHDLLSA